MLDNSIDNSDIFANLLEDNELNHILEKDNDNEKSKQNIFGQNIDTSKLSKATTLPQNFQLTHEFISAFDMMENTKNHIFLTGKAGTGKSTLLSYFREHSKKNIAVVAPTGIAAMNIAGSTIHAFFDFPLTYIDPDAIHKSRKLTKIYENIDTIIVDEVSMVRSDMIDGMDKALRINKLPNSPFGGVQMIFVGDLFQLPPVVTEESKQYIKNNYKSEYFFDAKVFEVSEDNVLFDDIVETKDIKLHKIQLENIFRQSDESFKSILNKIRMGVIDKEDLFKLNLRYKRDTKYLASSTDLTITLTTTNRIADTVNEYRLAQLETPMHEYTATVDGEFNNNVYPTLETLRLKTGAQIMMLKNDPERRWVNGSLGIITHLDTNSIRVDINGKNHEIIPESWRKIRYGINDETKRLEEIEIGSFTQIPIRLAWAVTIHKSQGQTFEKAFIDLSGGIFAHGQLYVALSRCKSLEGIILKSMIKESDLIVDRRIVEWMER